MPRSSPQDVVVSVATLILTAMSGAESVHPDYLAAQVELEGGEEMKVEV